MTSWSGKTWKFRQNVQTKNFQLVQAKAINDKTKYIVKLNRAIFGIFDSEEAAQTKFDDVATPKMGRRLQIVKMTREQVIICHKKKMEQRIL